MKRFLSALIRHWFVLTTPTRTSMRTLAEREYERKRRLLSFLLLIDLMIALTSIVMESLSILDMPLVFGWLGTIVVVFAFWLNRQGYLLVAALTGLFCAATMVFLSVQARSLSDPIALLWGLPELVFYLAMAGLLLPAWLIAPLAIIEHLVFYWYFFFVCYHRLTPYLSVQGFQSSFVYLSLWIYFCAFIGMTYAVTTARAVRQADRAVELEQAHQQLNEAYATIQKQALTDGLTGLPNHRVIIDQIGKELDRARRHGRALSLLFFDADRFKRINDTHGHGAGDAVLCQIGERAGSILRREDTLGRFGGEEFVIVLPETDTNEARLVAERVRMAVAAELVVTSGMKEGIMATVSIGISTYPRDADCEQDLLSQADEAMYLAKRLGRNQVRTAEEAKQVGADGELMALLQEAGQQEATQREGSSLEQLRENYTVRMICSLLSLLEERDESLSARAHAVSDLATTMAQAMGLEPQQAFKIGMAALLHDIGKVGIPDGLLQKIGPLSSQERLKLSKHAELGAEILEASLFLMDLVPGVRHHHEHWNGHGYPDQLAGEDIPLSARIIAVAEAYDLMQRALPCQAGCSAQEALAELRRCVGTQFDPAVVQALVGVLTNQESQQFMYSLPGTV